MLDARTHSSTFLDHRFGETSTNLTPEEKALERFTAERQSRLGKKTKFNLEDEDEGGFELTHGGRTLGFGDEEELESGGWGGLGVSEGANREPLLKRRKMGAEPVEDDVSYLAYLNSSLDRTKTSMMYRTNPNARRLMPKSWKKLLQNRSTTK